jgi:Pyruvate/2-oxoacid:ferredoxin oxidoreductase gamma subunit
MVLLGFAVSQLGHPFSCPAVREAIARVSPGPFLSHNLKAFELGFEKGSNQEKKRPEKGEET